MAIYYDCIYRDNPKEVSIKTCLQSWGKYPTWKQIIDHNYEMHRLNLRILPNLYIKHYVKTSTQLCVDCSMFECKKCGYCHTENCESRTICIKPEDKINDR